MSTYITIDGGTTNTRVSLVVNREVSATVKIGAGARAGIDNDSLLKTEIKKAIDKLLADNGLSTCDITRILASGMITSEFGLCNLPHISAPAGVEELHDSMHEIVIGEISPIPFVFIRGVRCDGADFCQTDVMRGEETELAGIADASFGSCVYVLPGSHSKIIKTDADGRIYDFSTMLTGEMIASLSGHTILKSAVDLDDASINEEYLLKGFDYCLSEGINKALFKTRVLKNFFDADNDSAYSFFIGVVLADEIGHIIKSDAETVVLGGKAQIKEAMKIILEKRDNKRIVSLDGKTVDASTSLGAVRIFEYEKQ